MAEKNYLPGAYYRYSLIIKKLLATPLRDSPDRQIVYSDRHRYTYKDFEKRTAMLANGLATLGLRPGETVAVFV
jgi:fatty-acyl-CoA synthase